MNELQTEQNRLRGQPVFASIFPGWKLWVKMFWAKHHYKHVAFNVSQSLLRLINIRLGSRTW